MPDQIHPFRKNDRYFYDIAESKELEGLTDEQIMAKRIELAGSYIGFYTTYDDYENDMRSYLDPDTEYVALAFGYISYITTGLFRSEPFSTPASQYGQDFGECTSGYYGDRYQTGKDNWRLALVAADKSYTLSLNCLADAVTGAAAGIPAGEYTFSADGAQGAFSILPDGSNVTNKSDQSSSAVKSGKLTVAYEGSACIIAADITDSEGNNVKGSFRGSVAATDYAAYPAIGQIVSAQVSFYGGGNWFINLYDYPLEGSSSYRLTFDLYVSTETSPSATGGLPEGTYDVVATGLGIRSNKDTKVEFASKQLCTIESGQMTVARATGTNIRFVQGFMPADGYRHQLHRGTESQRPDQIGTRKNAGEGHWGENARNRQSHDEETVRDGIPRRALQTPHADTGQRRRPAAFRPLTHKSKKSGCFPGQPDFSSGVLREGARIAGMRKQRDICFCGQFVSICICLIRL